jgi:hypothetical protein
MTSKTKLLFKRSLNSFLSFLKEKNNINDNNIIFNFTHSDMELGLIKAVEEIMSKTKIKICYFHFSQALMRKINNHFYEDLFQNIPNAKTLILSCKALSFIKPEFVNDVFYRLKEDVDDLNDPLLNDFYKYFESEYIFTFDSEKWNYYLQKRHLTNNASEGYNSKLLRLSDYKKPTFWHNIEIIRNELEYFTNRYYDLIANNSPPSPDTIANINRIYNLSINNSVNFNTLRLRYENNIEDIEEEIYIGMNNVDEDVFQIYIEFWYEKTKILSSYV